MDEPTADGCVLADSVSRSEGPTATAWAAHRETITALYQQEKLRTVREIMLRDHVFEVSERMYKTRIKDWGLDKKRKADEMAHALRIIDRRKAKSKATCVVIRDT